MAMTLKEKIDKYFELQNAIFEHVGYREDWKVIPLDNHTDAYWFITGEGHNDKYCYSPKPLTKESVEAGVEIYGGNIYTQRFLPKWIYRGEQYTVVCADTQCDGNKLLLLFDNTKECKDESLKNDYLNKWGKC